MNRVLVQDYLIIMEILYCISLVQMTNGYSIKDATSTAVDYASNVAKYVINNAPYPRSYQIPAINTEYALCSRLIELNKEFIATETVDRILATYPSHNITGGSLLVLMMLNKY